jgi:DNA-binding IclR family transcriptional regulator
VSEPKDDDSEKATRYEAPALEKGLDIVELLADYPDGMSQVEIARSLERSVGEIFRMLMCLVRRRWVTIKKPGDRYVLTLKVFELAHRHGPMERLPAEAQPILRALTRDIHQSCHLAVLDDDRAVVIAQVDSPGSIGFAVRTGTTAGLLTTASGRVLLAFQNEETRDRLMAHAIAAMTPKSKDLAAPQHLAKIRRLGFEEMESTRIRGIHDVSYPVFDHRGHAAAALTVPFIERLDLPGKGTVESARTAIKAAAAELTLAIGGVFAAEAAEMPKRRVRRRADA